LDNFSETQKAKTREIIEIGKHYKVSAFLQPGDFFDTANPGNDFVAEIAGMWGGGNAHDLLSRFRSGEINTEDVLNAIKDYIPLIGVAGNHELYGNNINTLDKTAIGLLNKWGLMRFATKENPYIFHTEDGLKVAITGTHYHLDIDTPEHIDDYVVDEKLGDFHIHIVHGMLSDKNMGKYIRHTLIDQVAHTKADLTISGHDHIGFPLTEIEGKCFVNTGAIPRLSNDLKEMKRKPKVLLIDISKEKGMQLEEIYLKTAVSGDMVLNRKKIEEKKNKVARLEDYKKAVKDAGMKKSTDIIEIIRDLADTKQISPIIKEEILNRVGNKKAEMTKETESIVEEAFITKIVMENFQSHAYTELDFKDGFNILVGESGQGKTSVLRAFNWVYDNKPSGKGLIRRGADYAKVSVYLSNGYVITRFAEAKKGGKNGYEIVDPSTGSIEFHNTKILPEVQKLLGYNQLVIDKDLQFNLNFMKQGTGWFMIGDNYPATQKAKILGSIYGVQYADSVVREFDSEERKVNDTIKKSNEELIKIGEKMGEYDYLQNLEQVIKEAEILLKEVEFLEERKSNIAQLVQKRKQHQAVIEENQRTLHSLQELPHIKEQLLKVRQQELHRNQLEKTINSHKEIKLKHVRTVEVIEQTKELERVKKGYLLTQDLATRKENIEGVLKKRATISSRLQEEHSILKETSQIEKVSEQVKQVKQQVNEREKIAFHLERATSLEKKRTKTMISLNAIEETIEKTKEIVQAKTLLFEMLELSKRQENIQRSLTTRKRYSAMVLQEGTAIEKEKKEIRQYALAYKDLLEKEGACPTCFGTIDATTVKRIVSKYQS